MCVWERARKRELKGECVLTGQEQVSPVVLCALPSTFLPPHLSQLKDVNGGLPQPDGGQLQAVPAGIQAPQSHRAPLGQPLHLPEPPAGVVLNEPAEAQYLDQHRRHQHEEESEAEPEVVLPLIVVQRQAKVRANVPEEDEEGEDDPEAVQPQLLPGRAVSLPDADPSGRLAPTEERAEAGWAAAPVASRGAAALTDVDRGGVQGLLGINIVQLGETAPAAPDPGFAAVRLRGHVPLPAPALLRNARQPHRFACSRGAFTTSLPRYPLSPSLSHRGDCCVSFPPGARGAIRAGGRATAAPLLPRPLETPPPGAREQQQQRNQL